MFNAIKNRIICFFIRHTYLNAGVCYAIAEKVSKSEMMHYYKMIEELTKYHLYDIIKGQKERQ